MLFAALSSLSYVPWPVARLSYPPKGLQSIPDTWHLTHTHALWQTVRFGMKVFQIWPGQGLFSGWAARIPFVSLGSLTGSFPQVSRVLWGVERTSTQAHAHKITYIHGCKYTPNTNVQYSLFNWRTLFPRSSFCQGFSHLNPLRRRADLSVSSGITQWALNWGHVLVDSWLHNLC